MALISPSVSALVFAVFGMTTTTLFFSVSRDLQSAPGLEDWKLHFNNFPANPAQQAELLADAKAALSIVLRSEISVFLMVQWCFAAYAMFALTTIVVFLGRLSPREASMLTERLVKYVVFKVVFCGALIIPDVYEIIMWMTWFAMVGFMRVFLGAAKDRLDSLMQSPSASVLSHVRPLMLVLLIMAHDLAGVVTLISSVNILPMTKVLLCAFDMGIVLVEGGKTLIHYAVNLYDRHMSSLSDLAEGRAVPAALVAGVSDVARDEDLVGASTPSGRWEAWEGKGSLLLHMDLVADLLVHMMTLAHYVHVWFLHGLTFQLIDAILFLDIRSILVSLLKRIHTYLVYRRATHSLQHTYPDAFAEHDPCAICMERMLAAKQLPCGHIFHLACLRAWLQQSGSESFACPLCRAPLMRNNSGRPGAPARARHGWAVVDTAARVATWMYLDILFALLVGLPISTSSPQRPRHVAVAAPLSDHRVEVRQRRMAASRTLVEEVDESVHPSPAARAAYGSRAGSGRSEVAGMWQTWLHHLQRGWTRRRAAPVAAAARAWPGEGGSDDEGSGGNDEGGEATSGDLDDSFMDPLESDDEPISGAAAGDSFHCRSSQEGRPARRRARGGQLPGSDSGGHTGGDAVAGTSRDHLRPLVLPPPSQPPPYMDPPTWSAGSIHFLAQYVSSSIHSSLGMGVRGPGTIAGLHHSTDQEAESPYQNTRRRPLDMEVREQGLVEDEDVQHLPQPVLSAVQGSGQLQGSYAGRQHATHVVSRGSAR